MAECQPIRINVYTRGGVIGIDTAGLVVPSTPGLLITPFYAAAAPVRGRFTLTHPSGTALLDLGWCAHDARRWADAAGWIGVDWRADADDLIPSPVARLFAWRLADEFRPHCDVCPEVPGDRHRAAYADRRADRVR